MKERDLTITVTLDPSNEEVNYLTQKINEESLALGIKEIASPFAILMRNESGEIVGGCNGSIFFRAIYTDQLWVHRTLRKKGLGRLLMEKVHQLGATKNCAMSILCTMNFQGAEGFYRHLGYIQDFERSGYSNNGSCIFFRKMLSNT